jgi:hypothetical protein
MNFDETARATLIAYFFAHKRWKKTPSQHKTDKGIAKELRDEAHSKVLSMAEVLAHKEI